MTDTLMTGDVTTSEVETIVPAATVEPTEPTPTNNEGESNTTKVEEPKAEEPKGAPDKYEFTPPEGKEFDSTVIGAFSEVAKELNLTNADAQKLLDKVSPVMVSRQLEQIAAVHKDWETKSSSDKEFGGDKLQDNLSSAKKALDTFGTPELKTFLNESGLGNHPELIRLLYRAGKAISEDKFVGGKQPAQDGGKSLAEKLYS